VAKVSFYLYAPQCGQPVNLFKYPSGQGSGNRSTNGILKIKKPGVIANLQNRYTNSYHPKEAVR
jgi:hypothetical protein